MEVRTRAGKPTRTSILRTVSYPEETPFVYYKDELDTCTNTEMSKVAPIVVRGSTVPTSLSWYLYVPAGPAAAVNLSASRFAHRRGGGSSGSTNWGQQYN